MKNVELSRQQHLDLYYHMRLNRAVEDTMVKLFRQNKIVGGLTPALGRKRFRSAPRRRSRKKIGSRR